MNAPRPLFVAGFGMTPFRAHHAENTVTDLARQAIHAALEDAQVSVALIDEVVFANESDHLSRQVTLAAMVQSDAGLCDRPLMRVEAGGATGAVAVRAASALLRGGDAQAVLVCGAEKTGRDVASSLASEIFAMSADVDFEFPMGVTFPALYAMMLQAHIELYGTTMEQVATVAVKNFRNGERNKLAHRGSSITVGDVRTSPAIASPYRALDCSVLSDGAAAIVLATESWMEAHASTSRPAVALVGTGSATAPSRLGDRLVDGKAALANFSAKRRACEIAYSKAGVTNPRVEIDVAEVYDSFSGVEIQACEDLRFCDYGDGGPAAAAGRFDYGGDVVVNPSGGLLARGAASGATGIAQIVEIATQLRGEALDRQVKDATLGLTDTHAGVGSISVVHLFERRQPFAVAS
jgi:acetyl-CoA C-acetyltransferase